MDNIELAATFCTFSNIDLDWLKAGAEDELKLALELDMEGDERGQRVLASDPSERHSDTPWCLLARPFGVSVEMIVPVRARSAYRETEVVPAGVFAGLREALRFVSAAHYDTLV
jgi:hypothetical protein